MTNKSLVSLLCAAAALAAGPYVAQAQITKTHGIDFSPYLPGQNPNLGSSVSESQIRTRLEVIAPFTVWVRSFGSSRGNEHTPRLARQLGLKVAANAWISSNTAQNDIEIANLIAAVNAGYVDIAIVGSEAILRNDVSVSQLIAYMNQVRAAVPAGIPVTTADVWGTFIQHPALIAASDLIFANFYPYWEGVAVENAVCVLQQQYQQLVQAAGGRPVVVSETGWPSQGNAVGAAVPSPANSALYALQYLTWAKNNAILSFYFSAFDEAWKTAYEGPQGAHWGLWGENGVIKPGMDAFFNGQSAAVVCNGVIPGPLALAPVYVPPYGSLDAMSVQATGVRSADYKIAAYINVAGGWWTKPTFAQPTVPLNPDGTASIAIATGGSDNLATGILAFLIPVSSTPPPVGGGGKPVLPDAVASFEVTRTQRSISGTVTDNLGHPLRGVVVSEPALGTTRTAPNGKYSFFNMTFTGALTLSASYPNYRFPNSPAAVSPVNGNQIVDFPGGVATVDLAASASLSQTTVLPGEAVTGTIVASNAGPAAATNAVLTVSIPASFTLNGVTTTRGSCNSAVLPVTCNLGPLPASAYATVTVSMQAGSAGSYVFGSSVTGPDLDSDPSNNVANLNIGVAALQSIAVTPPNPSIPLPGTIQFTATGTYSNGASRDLTGNATWTSDNTSVATIAASGLAIAVGPGGSLIRATLGSVSGSTLLTVNSAPPPPPGSGTSFFTALPGPYAEQFDYSGWKGVQLNMGSTAIRLTQLARKKGAGNTLPHRVGIFAGSWDSPVPVAEVTVNMANTPDADGFVWGTLTTPYQLQPYLNYFIASLEEVGAGKDKWMVPTTTTAPGNTGVAVPVCAVWGLVSPAGNNTGLNCFRSPASVNYPQPAGPVNFRYEPIGGPPPPPVLPTVVGVGLSQTVVTLPNPVTGTVTLSGPAPTGGAVVALTSSNTSVAQPVNGNVTVSANSTSATFQINTLAPGTATFTASYNSSSATSPVLTVNPAPPPPPGSGTSFFTALPGPYAEQFDYSGWKGVQLNMGSTAIRVTQLGRKKNPGNALTHRVGIFAGSWDSPVPVAEVTVNMANTPDADGFVWGTLTTPYQLQPYLNYFVASLEEVGAGKDKWMVPTTTTAPGNTGVAVPVCAVWGLVSPAGNNTGLNCFRSPASVNYPQPAGPVNFRYESSGGPPPPPTLPTVVSVGLSQTVVTLPTPVTGTVTLSGPAPTGGAVVTLTSNNPSVAQPVSATVTVPANTTTATFQINTLSPGTATITASYNNSSATSPILTVNSAPPPPPGSGTSFFTALPGPYAEQFDYSGWKGVQLNMGSTAIRVTQLARKKGAGNALPHRVGIFAGSWDSPVPVAEVTVNMANTPDADGFVWGTLTTPYQLQPYLNYFVASLEEVGAGKDKWMVPTTTTAPGNTGVAVPVCAVWGLVSPAGNNTGLNCFRSPASVNYPQPAGPVNFRYLQP